jgi:hypothetical protein
MTRIVAALGGLLLTLLLASACAESPTASKSLSFDAKSGKAIVVLGGSIFWKEDFRDPDQSLTLHWQAFDPKTLRLVPEGKGFSSLTRGAVRLKIDDPYPPARVLQVEPGSYALVAAGSGLSKTLYVPVQDRYKNKWGQTWVNDHYVDPLEYIEPQAQLAYGKNYLFSVEAGQIVYLGHFAFGRASRYLGRFSWARRIEDEAAARAVLAEYPGIAGTMIVVDPAKPPQSVFR